MERDANNRRSDYESHSFMIMSPTRIKTPEEFKKIAESDFESLDLVNYNPMSFD
jgi:hypothetical protein